MSRRSQNCWIRQTNGSWSNESGVNKAIVDVLNFDGAVVSHNEFVTNQKAADFMVPFVTENRQFDINYQPIGCRPICSACANKG